MNIILERNGDILLSKYPELGKRYKLLDRLKGKGIGTSKLYYIKGIEIFDEIQQLNQDVAFVNFEPTSAGFILHFNKTNRIRAYGLPLNQLKKVTIKQEKIGTNTSNFRLRSGILSIKTITNLININIPSRKVEKVILFFETYLLQNQLVVL